MSIKDVSKEMVGEEYELSQRLLKLAESIESGVIKELLTTVAFDSEKHSHLYVAILDLLDKSRRMVPESDIEKVQDEIDLHIKIEAKLYIGFGEKAYIFNRGMLSTSLKYGNMLCRIVQGHQAPRHLYSSIT